MSRVKPISTVAVVKGRCLLLKYSKRPLDGGKNQANEQSAGEQNHGGITDALTLTSETKDFMRFQSGASGLLTWGLCPAGY